MRTTKALPLSILLWMLVLALNHPTRLHGQDQALSLEGKARKSAHEFLFGEFLKGKDARFKGEGDSRVLDELVISSQRVEVSGEVSLDLPIGAERVASLFRYLILRGEGLDGLQGLVMLPYSPDSELAVSTKETGLYRVKIGAMPVPGKSMPPIRIRSICEPGKRATITEIAFNSQSKLPVKFNDIPYRNLGAEFPRDTVDVTVDLQNELSLDGHVDLEREKFCRYYAAPGNLDASFENWAAERNFLPGRQIMKLQPTLVVGYSKDQPKLAESTEKPGAADLRFFDRYDSSAPVGDAIMPFRGIKYAMCFNDYPEFMSVKTVGRGTPLIERFGDAAELAAAYVADQIKDAGRTATYWEVKNESTIKSEWDYHWSKEHDAWALMAEFHNRVADAVHEKAPDVMVGGPSSAWMQLQVSDFELYRNQTRFMNLTKRHVDFYSHHFYEDIGSLGAWERRRSKYTNYLMGRMEAILDMLQAHMHETDNVKPMLVTECGSLQPGRGPSDYWLRIRSYSAYMHKLMSRPDQIDLAVPFAFLSMPWNPQSGDAAFIPKMGMPSHSTLKDCDPTPLVHFFELWRDFDGRRLPVSFDRQWLDVTAVYEGNRVRLAITNMGGQRLAVNVSSLVGGLSIESVSQRRLYYRDGQVIYEDAITHEDARSIPVAVEETTIVTLRLKTVVETGGTISRKRWYAAGTARKSTDAENLRFSIEVKGLGTVAAATLVVGVQREGGLGGRISGSLNQTHFELNSEWADEMNHLFAPLTVRIPIGTLKTNNSVTINTREGLTITSVHLRTDHRMMEEN